MEEYRSHGHSISLCKYHFVWCPKYRHGVLGRIQDELEELFRGTAERLGHDIVSMEVSDDYVHLFVEADPK